MIGCRHTRSPEDKCERCGHARSEHTRVRMGCVVCECASYIKREFLVCNCKEELLVSTIHLGDRVRDRVSGFEGLALGKAVYLYGATEWFVQPTTLKSDDGSITATVWVQEGRLDVIGEADEKFRGFKPQIGGCGE